MSIHSFIYLSMYLSNNPTIHKPDLLGVRDVLHPVGEEVGVGGAPDEGPKLHHADESAQIVNLMKRK